MTSVPNRYLEDLTGTSPNNKVVNDVYELSAKDVRSVVVRYGPYYADSLVVYDDVTNQPLTKDIDYSCIGLLPELTSRTGKGIYDALLITNKSVSHRVRLSEYQVVGGHYHNQAHTLSKLVEASSNDGRPVDWLTGVLNRPKEFPPSIHAHWLQDVVGFGPLVAALDRIASAITIGQAPIFNFLFSRLDLNRATLEDVIEGTSNTKFITPEQLKHALENMNFNAMYLTPYIERTSFSKEIEFRLTTNKADAFTKMFWEIEHETSDDSDFTVINGEFEMKYGEGTFKIKTGPVKYITEDRKFKVRVRRDTIDGPVMIKSLLITIPKNWEGGSEEGITSTRMASLYSSCCIYDSENRDPMAMFYADK